MKERREIQEEEGEGRRIQLKVREPYCVHIEYLCASNFLNSKNLTYDRGLR